ncbi:MAG: D-alanyl-D-alanine carboxypeptidase family protein [Butyricicoccaceae bacterium]
MDGCEKLVRAAAMLGLLLMNAAALPELGALHAKSAALYAANGQELYVSNADEKLQPASVTKIMTMLLAMEALERGEVTLDTMITGSEHACSMGGTQIWLEPGGRQPTLDEMLMAIAVGSAKRLRGRGWRSIWQGPRRPLSERDERPGARARLHGNNVSSMPTVWTARARGRSRPRETSALYLLASCWTPSEDTRTTRAASGWTASGAENSRSRTRTRDAAQLQGWP